MQGVGFYGFGIRDSGLGSGFRVQDLGSGD